MSCHPRSTSRVPFAKAYDLATVKPKPEYEAAMLRVMDELARLGMRLK
ncbi:MAG: hypothetical protein ABSA52_17260 [Candidatus Binatia bacterium]|jgi:hypothetical protein